MPVIVGTLARKSAALDEDHAVSLKACVAVGTGENRALLHALAAGDQNGRMQRPCLARRRAAARWRLAFWHRGKARCSVHGMCAGARGCPMNTRMATIVTPCNYEQLRTLAIFSTMRHILHTRHRCSHRIKREQL